MTESIYRKTENILQHSDGTKVRSKSEQFIADWFYRHSIKYEYEPLTKCKGFCF